MVHDLRIGSLSYRGRTVDLASMIRFVALAIFIGMTCLAPAFAEGMDTELFEALKAAPDDESAKYIENRIWAIWLASASDTANLLMGRVKTAVDAQEFDLAIKLLNAVIDIKPDFVEAWNRRATVYYAEKEFGRALSDIHEVLTREPRHFGALSGLGIILQEIGDEKHALEVLRRALSIHPHLEKIPDLVKKLSEKVD